MKKKSVIIFATIIIIIAIAGGLFVFSGLERVEVQTHSYLLEKGYTNDDIDTINVNFSLLNWNLSYMGWTSKVEFIDEPDVKYEFILDGEKIVANGVTGKMPAQGALKHFE